MLPSNTTNVTFIGKPFKQNFFEQKLKKRTEMVGTKLITVQCQALIQPPAEVLIQTDASTKG